MHLNHLKPFPRASNAIKLLHVDDDESQLVMMQELLRVFDPDVLVDSVNNPEEVLDKIRNNWYDCLVTDYQMPQANGIELAVRVRKESSIPIILYTGRGSEDVAEMAFSVGINDYFRKEINPQHYQVLAKRIRDVVDKRRMEHLYTNVVKDARDSILIALDDKVVYANQSLLDLFGVRSNNDIIDKKIHSVLNIEKTFLTEEVTKLMSGEKTFSITEIEIKQGRRKRTPVEMNLSVIEYLGEKATLCFLRDITDRKLFETELKKSETRYRSLLELAPDGIMTIDMRGTLTWVNPAYTTITGFTKEEIVGKKVWSIGAVRPSDIKTFIGLFLDQIKGKQTPTVEFQWVRKDGELGWGEGRASLLKVDDKITEVLLINRDITERKRLEEDLKKYTKEMEQLAEERAQKLIESENLVAAGAIASTVAHDLRGPLSAIRNAVYIMETQPDKAVEMRGTISKALDNAVGMLNDVQEKMNLGVIKVEDVELAEFIKSVVSETPIPPHIKVRININDMVIPMDRRKMRRVLENLIRNAIDAMPKRGKITISNRVMGAFVLIDVKDTGIGIPKDRISDLFKPFSTTKGTGMGLGLYYCKKTLEAHNGTIDVKSKKGSGTMFTLLIPHGFREDHNPAPMIASALVDPFMF